MKIVFFGNSDISAVFLEHILSDNIMRTLCEVSSVVTIPPRPSGRGLKIQESVVKQIALAKGIGVIFETENLTNDKNLVSRLRGLSPDVGVVVSYGKIIPPDIFTIPRYGCINLHFSLLPHLRGAAPIQWALIRGEKKTGASVFFINEKLDNGDVLVQKEVEITDEEDFFSLKDKLTKVGTIALNESLVLLSDASKDINATPQSEIARVKGEYYQPSYAPIIKKSDGKINWSKPACEIHNLIRGLVGWPVAYTFLPDGRMIKIFKSKVEKICCGSNGVCPSRRNYGEITGILKGEGFLVACGDGNFLKILEVQPANSRKMSAWEFIIGGGIKAGERFIQE